MKFALIICTYMRLKPLLQLLQSVQGQTVYPDEILIVDGLVNREIKFLLKENLFENLRDYLVSPE
jgi:glycosyltransferase involved in cell wall biosynthesis